MKTKEKHHHNHFRDDKEDNIPSLKIKMKEREANEDTKSSVSLMKNKKVVGLLVVGVFVVGFSVYYWKSLPSSATNEGSKKKRVRWADNYNGEEEETEETMEQIEERERQNYELLLQEERMMAANDIEMTLNEIDKLKAAVAENEGQSKKAKNDMSEMFGDEKAGYDSFLSSMETEQSFDTAFMMKGQLDDKKQGMMDHSKELSLKHNQLMGLGEKLGQQYEFLQNSYKEKFGTTYIPQRAIQAKAQAEQQQQLALQQEQQMMAQRKQQEQMNAPPPGFEHYAQKV